jgi:hypothetical protein
MRSLRFLLPISVPILLAGSVHAQNLLTNGSFESPDVAAGTAELFASIPGWDNTGDPCPIEVQDNCCGSPSDGAQLVELDSDFCSSSISQTVTTQTGGKYVLSFDFSARPGVFENRLIVRWNGSMIFDETELSPPGPGDTFWVHHAIAVTSTGTSSTVEFAGADAIDGAGTLIDNLPEPGRAASLAAGLSLLAGLSRVHRRGRSR